MKQTILLQLAARKHVPATSIYVEVHTQSGHLGQRNTLVLMPGGPGNDHTVCDQGDAAFVDAVLPYVDVILFDPRGCGKSEKSPIKYCTMEHYIDDVETIRKHFHVSSDKSILMGVSYGAIAALGYAIQYPLEFKKLILVGGAASGESIQQARENLAKIGSPEQRKIGEKILTGTFTLTPDIAAGYYEIMGPLYSRTFKPGLPAPNIAYNVELANLGFKTFLKHYDYRPKLSQVKAEALIIAGEYDWIADKRQAEIIHHGIPNSKLIVYQECGHMIWIDQREKFLHDIINFIKA